MTVRSRRYLMYASIITTVASMLAGLYIWDLTWIITSIFGLIVLFIPYHFTKDMSSCYYPNILIPLPIILTIFVISAVIFGKNIGLFTDMWPLSILIQAAALMTYGYLAMIATAKHGKSEVSRRWMLVYSMLIPNTFVALYSFYIIAVMFILGFPVDNEEFTDMSVLRTYNWYMMAQMTITFFFTVAYGLFLKFYLKKVPKDVLTSYTGGSSDE